MMKKIAFTLLFSSVVFSSAFAQEIASDFKIEGNQRLENNTIISYLPFSKGETLGPNDINKAIKALYKTGFFDDVQVDLTDKVLFVKVVERPVISAISF